MVTIYLSSSFEDLKVHREAVYKALNQLAGVKVVAMEDYVARDDRPLDACLADVTQCDVYIGLFAWRYGHVPPGPENPEGLSITALELAEARKHNKPSLVFILDEKAAWPVHFLDSQSGENERGASILRLRKRLFDESLASKFTGDPATLATAVSNAVSNQLRKMQPGLAEDKPAHQRLQREVTHALYLAHHPADGDLSLALAGELGTGLERPVLLTAQALFASDELAARQREENVVACHAAAMLVTPASLPALLTELDAVTEALHVLHARSGSMALLLRGVANSDLPKPWLEYPGFTIRGDASSGWEDTLRPVNEWLRARQPPAGYRSVGVPVCVVAMTTAEVQALEREPALRNRLSDAEKEHFRQLSQALSALPSQAAGWSSRYGNTRYDWRPFGVAGPSVREIAEQMADGVSARGQGRQRQRHVKLQWYPFDALVTGNTRLRPAYRSVARAGCIMLLDEVSLFHPVLRETFQQSPFFNNDQVAIVTVSPFDPSQWAGDALLEGIARSKLAGAFDRYAVEFDPQCELAVADQRRLKRWLYGSLPATLMRLQEPGPDRAALGALAEELGQPGLMAKRDYGWGGGGR